MNRPVARKESAVKIRMLTALLVAVTLAGPGSGCGHPEVRYQRADFPFEQLLTGRLATVGFVLGSRVAADPTAASASDELLPPEVRQSWAWAPHLETALLVQAPEMDRWSFASVADQIESERLAVPLRRIARGSILTVDELQPLAVDLPGVQFVLAGRLVRNELSLESQEARDGVLERNPTGLGKPGGDADAGSLDRSRYYLRREVTVGLELYDLVGQRSVWSAQVEVDDNQLLDVENSPVKPRVRVESDPESPAGVRIEGAGGLQGGPALDRLLDEACSKLVGELLARARPADETPGGD